MLDMFANNKVFIAPDLDINTMMATMTEEEIEERLNEKAKENPKNAVFKADDFRPEFIEMLQTDQIILERMCSEWQEISDDDDSKFAKFKELLKHELFKAERNPEQKLVVFSESVDTVNYLQRRINRPDVLVISSDNRGQQFKTIRENFDANYKTKLNDYNIILTTDVLAEGVNLHRSNVIVNYDTPWNSTRLMQRIGRVNRIGSVSKHIYNYVFYPSREGNREINLNQIAVSKIQTFHSTFGEDNQIYSQNEILDRSLSKLFDEALKEQKKDYNQEIPYQLDDLNNDHTFDELCFLVDLKGKETRDYEVILLNEGEPHTYPPRVYAEMVVRNEKVKQKNKHDNYINAITANGNVNSYNMLHHHGVAFESELNGIRIYFDKRQTLDLYGKRYKRLEIKDTQFYTQPDQKTAGYGDDVLWVGNSFGLGALRGWNGQEPTMIEPVCVKFAFQEMISE